MPELEKYYWLNDNSRLFLERGYLLPGVTPEQRVREIAEYAERLLEKPGFADKFEDYMSRGWYSLASPIWSNFGLDRGLPISCQGVDIGDSIPSILTKVAEIGMQTKNGAGTSAFLGNLRARGSEIKGGGTTGGPIHFAELINTTVNVISQSNIRRGSCAIYLPVEHPDILEFLLIKSEGHLIQDLSFGVTITDQWMEDMISGNKQNRIIWAAILKKRYQTGYPYIFFTDTVNDNAPQAYKDKGKRILASNLCVTGDQRVPTQFGLLTAKELYELNQPLTLFDNDKLVKSSPMQMVEESAPVFKVTLENGLTHKITGYHKVVTREKTRNRFGVYNKSVTECKDLNVGDHIAFQTNKGIFGQKSMVDEAYLLGWYQADGTQAGKTVSLCVWENAFDIVPDLQESYQRISVKYDKSPLLTTSFKTANCGDSKEKKVSLNSSFLKTDLGFEKGVIPNWIWESDEETQWKYLQGLYEADGTANMTEGKGNPIYLSISSINKKFLLDLQILLLNLGIKSAVSLLREEGQTLLPDQKGGKKLYNTKDCFRLVTGNKNDCLVFEQNTNFLSRKEVPLVDRLYRDNSKKFSRIKSIEELPPEPVYCVKVDSEDHLWICNGFITHNCSEICLSSTPEESFVCDLSSMNLRHYFDWRDTDAIEILLYFLEANMTDYINKVKDIPYMQPSYKFAIEQRAIGLGGLGWHTLLQENMIPFESLKAKSLNIEIWKLIDQKSLAASREMAEVYGEPELLKGYGLRHITRLSIAPTTSSSFILGQVSKSIEPMQDNYFVADLAKGKFSSQNPTLKTILEKYERDDESTWKSILRKGGSVQHLDFLSDLERDVFKTFGEISQKEIVIQAAGRQKYIDQSQSLNLMIHPKSSAKEASELLIYGWREGIKTFYYQKGTNAAQELGRTSILECVSCQG